MSSEKRAEAEKYNESGKKLFSRQRYSAAIEQYTNALNVYGSAKYFQNRGMAYYQLREFEKSEDDCRHSLELQPNEVKPLYFLGMILMEKKKFNEAISCFSKALFHNSDIYNTATIENWLRKARKEKYEEEEAKKQTADAELLSYLESLMLKDLESETVSQQKHDSLKKRLTELFATSSENRTRRSIPDVLCGKITLELMKDPVIVPSGITYDRDEIVQHLKRIGHFDPVTRKPLDETQLIPNIALREVIENYLEENPWAKYDPSYD